MSQPVTTNPLVTSVTVTAQVTVSHKGSIESQPVTVIVLVTSATLTAYVTVCEKQP